MYILSSLMPVGDIFLFPAHMLRGSSGPMAPCFETASSQDVYTYIYIYMSIHTYIDDTLYIYIYIYIHTYVCT